MKINYNDFESKMYLKLFEISNKVMKYQKNLDFISYHVK